MAGREGLTLDAKATQALVRLGQGDMRRVLNVMQVGAFPPFLPPSLVLCVCRREGGREGLMLDAKATQALVRLGQGYTTGD